MNLMFRQFISDLKIILKALIFARLLATVTPWLARLLVRFSRLFIKASLAKLLRGLVDELLVSNSTKEYAL